MTSTLFYTLDGKTPKPTDDLLEFAAFFEVKENRILEQTYIRDVFVSTVFLGIDHGYRNYEPVLFETMVFGGENDGHQERYKTYDQALKGHHKICALVLGVEI